MKTKFFALGAVLLMCITAFACVSIVSDDSDAASSGTAGSISHPLSGTATLYTSSYYTGSQTYMYGLVVPGTVITVIDNVSHGAFSFESTSGWNVSGNTYTKTISGKDDSLRIAGIGFSFYPVRNVGIIDADNFVPAGQGGTTSSDPALGINASNIEWMDPQRYYVAKGSSINATENNDDLYAYLTTQIPGLTMSNGTLSGTVTANGTYTVYTGDPAHNGDRFRSAHRRRCAPVIRPYRPLRRERQYGRVHRRHGNHRFQQRNYRHIPGKLRIHQVRGPCSWDGRSETRPTSPDRPFPSRGIPA